MKKLKVLVQDTQCHNCERRVNRRTAEVEDWTEVLFVDASGMAISRAYICQHCEETWNYKEFEVVTNDRGF